MYLVTKNATAGLVCNMQHDSPGAVDNGFYGGNLQGAKYDYPNTVHLLPVDLLRPHVYVLHMCCRPDWLKVLSSV